MHASDAGADDCRDTARYRSWMVAFLLECSGSRRVGHAGKIALVKLLRPDVWETCVSRHFTKNVVIRVVQGEVRVALLVEQ